MDGEYIGLLHLRIVYHVHLGQEDPRQSAALASIWMLILAFGCSACLIPIIYAIDLAYQKAVFNGIPNGGQVSGMEFFYMVNVIIFMQLGCLIGYPITSASSKASSTLHANMSLAIALPCTCY